MSRKVFHSYRTEPWPGVTGNIPFSAALDDAGEVFLTRLENGAWKYYSREDLGVPRGKIAPKKRVDREAKDILSAAEK